MKKNIIVGLLSCLIVTHVYSVGGSRYTPGRITPSPSPTEIPPRREQTPSVNGNSSTGASTTPTPRQTPQPVDLQDEDQHPAETSQRRATTVPLTSMRRNNGPSASAIRPVAISPTASTSRGELRQVQTVQRTLAQMQRRFNYPNHDQVLSANDVEFIRTNQGGIRAALDLLERTTTQQVGYGRTPNRWRRQQYFHLQFLTWLTRFIDNSSDNGASS